MSKTALIVTDMLNAYDHPDAEPLMDSVEAALPAIRARIQRARDDGELIVYVNDNYGLWTSNRDELVERAVSGPHGRLVAPVAPEPEFLFVVKARHSIFYQTPLEYLLRQEEVERIVLTGQVTEQCIFYSALDAYIRHFEVEVPRDAVAHIHADLAEAALRMMELNLHTDISRAHDRG